MMARIADYTKRSHQLYETAQFADIKAAAASYLPPSRMELITANVREITLAEVEALFELACKIQTATQKADLLACLRS